VASGLQVVGVTDSPHGEVLWKCICFGNHLNHVHVGLDDPNDPWVLARLAEFEADPRLALAG
jgi:hypothetical protein